MAESPGTGGAPSQVQETKEQAKGQAQEVASTVAEHASAVTQEAKGKATDVVHDVRRELQTQGDSQAQRLAAALHDVSGQLDSMAQGAQPGTVTDATRQLAQQGRSIAGRLEEGGVQGIGQDLTSFARRRPVLFLAAAGVAGFAVTRMLRNAPSLTGSPSAGPGTGPGMPQSAPPTAPMVAEAVLVDIEPVSALP